MTKFDVLTVGNAIVDIIARCDDQFLVDHKITKAAMNLIDAERAQLLYNHMGPALEASGGSAGNTAAGIASFGGKAAYFGKVAEDQLGEIFAHDIRAQGVHYQTQPKGTFPPTARSMIFVTEDGERSMNTYLGACVELGPEDVEPEVVAQSKVTYFEGYLWDPPRAKEAIRDCARIAHENGREVSMTLSDSFCVGRYRDEFLDLMRSGTVDIVFANRQEALALYETEDFEDALVQIAKDCKIAAVTMSEEGAVILKGSERYHVDAIDIKELVDTTGAGDLFAAGFLYGYTQGRTLERLSGIGTPDFRLRHPTFGAVDLGEAPVAVAFADIHRHARLELGDDGCRRQRFAAHVDEDALALALHPRGGNGSARTREQRLVDPALGAIGIANLAPVVVFLDDLDRQAGFQIHPRCGIIRAGADAQVDALRLQGDETRQGQAARAFCRLGMAQLGGCCRKHKAQREGEA
jgi:sugar/nucleoside kinase (ribokinase family)